MTAHVHKDGVPGPPGCPGGPPADLDVTVRATPTGYRWDFGDGLPSSALATDDLGKPYPQVSTIQYDYERASAAGFTVELTAHFDLAYQAGGDWQTLGSANRTASAAYQVQEAVPVVVNQG